MKNRKLIILAVVIVTLLVVILIFSLGTEKAEPVAKTGSISSASAASDLDQARLLQSKGDFIAAGDIYRRLIEDFPASGQISDWQNKITELNIKILFSPEITAESTTYKIKSGDSLEKIAKKFGTTVELLKKSNGFSDDKIYTGQEIKVWTAPFSLLVDKSQNMMILKSNEEVFKTYIVATGEDNSTPVGIFNIVEKLTNPTWYRAGAVIPPDSPDNVLGTRWLGFDLSGYGIHGTTEPESLGKQVTQGCVRLSNADVEELYIIIPKGTEVTIVD